LVIIQPNPLEFDGHDSQPRSGGIGKPRVSTLGILAKQVIAQSDSPPSRGGA